MNGIAIGLFVGAYFNNPALRRTVDSAVKKAIGYGIDTLNGKKPNPAPSLETDTPEAE